MKTNFILIIFISIFFQKTYAQNQDIQKVVNFIPDFINNIVNNNYAENHKYFDENTSISEDSLIHLYKRFNDLINHDRNNGGYFFDSIVWNRQDEVWINNITTRVDHANVTNSYFLYFLKIEIKLKDESIIINKISLSDGSYFGEKTVDIYDKSNMVDAELLDDESFMLVYKSNGKEYSNVYYFQYVDDILSQGNEITIIYYNGHKDVLKIKDSKVLEKFKKIEEKFSKYKLLKSVKEI